MKKRSAHSFGQKQLKIMKVALGIFARKGYNGSSVRDIAQASNVNLAMINYYFGSKLQLLEAIFENMAEVSKEQIDSFIVNDKLSPIQKLDNVIDGYVRFAIENRDFIILLMRQQFSTNNDAIDDLIFSLKFRYWRIFYTALEEAKKVGAFRDDINITTISSLIMGTLNFLISNKIFLSKIQNLDPENEEEYNRTIIETTMSKVKSMLEEYLAR